MPAIILFQPEEPEANGAYGYEHVVDGLAFTWSSHGKPRKAVVRVDGKENTYADLTPEDVVELLRSHPMYVKHGLTFVNSCWSGVGGNGNSRSLAAEVARLSGKPALGWMGTVNTKNVNGKNLLWIERGGQVVGLRDSLKLFHPDGRVEAIEDPQSLFDRVELVERRP